MSYLFPIPRLSIFERIAHILIHFSPVFSLALNLRPAAGGGPVLVWREGERILYVRNPAPLLILVPIFAR